MGGPAFPERVTQERVTQERVTWEIEHISRYLYPSPVRQCVLSLCLKPRDDGEQRLLSFELVTDPPAPISSETDIFGNTKLVLTIHREHQALEIVSRSTVRTLSGERRPVTAMPDSLGAGAWDEIRSLTLGHPSESFSYWDFTHPSALARPSPALAAYIEELDIRAGDDPLESLLQLVDTLHRSFRYVPGSTSAVSPIEHILESREGVCQDYAQVMIAIARSWRVPARYVSGYLYLDGKDPSQADGAPQTATHAWVECYLPGLGWTGFDPTNRCLADQRYIRVAVGRDYQDVPPVRGIFVGHEGSQLDVVVRINQQKRSTAP